jgi:hypothetical protein
MPKYVKTTIVREMENKGGRTSEEWFQGTLRNTPHISDGQQYTAALFFAREALSII